MPSLGWHLHNWRRLEVILTQPLGLAQSQNLRVAQATEFALELIQRVGFGGQSSSDLLSDYLHNLRGEEGRCLAAALQTDGGLWVWGAAGAPDVC